MKQKILQFSATIFLSITGLTANSQNWLIAGNSNTANTNFIGTKNTQPLILKTNNVERMRLTKNGQIGIGLINPTYALQVTTSSLSTAISGFTSVAGGNGLIAECDNGANSFGIWGICGSSTGYAGYFSGNLAYTGTLTGPSDQKLKENIKPIENMLDKVMQLKPSSYNFKKGYEKMNFAPGNQIGFIAQDMEKVFPQLVSTIANKNLDGTVVSNYKGINYIGVIPILTKAIQEQQKIIADMKAENELMKKENDELTLRVDKIEQALAINGKISTPVTLTDARLEQNAPNPFNRNTVINYYLPQKASSAVISITDMNGKVIKTVPLTDKGSGQLTLEAAQLTAGTYQYSLFINGKLLDTKKMILTK